MTPWIIAAAVVGAIYLVSRRERAPQGRKRAHRGSDAGEPDFGGWDGGDPGADCGADGGGCD